MRRLLTTLALLAPAAAQASPCAGPVCNFETLAPYFARVARVAQARHAPVHILQIGDSHTAGDVLTGAWRTLLQTRYGDGGRGVLPPGRPYAGYLTHDITATMSPGWRVAATFGAGAGGLRPPLGLSSYALTSTMPGATIGLTADPGRGFDRFVLCALAGPGAGSVAVRLGDGAVRRVSLAGATPKPRCERFASPVPQSAVSLAASDAPVTLTSWATFREGGGIVLSNLGVVGAQLGHFARTDDATVAEELHSYAPDLIVLAFGTNEGFAPHFDPLAYEATLRGQIARLRALAPGVPLLLLGPPDALTRNAALRTNASGAAIECGDGLFAPPALAEARSIQRKVAGALGLAWWDWQQRMGGACSAVGWAAAAPPLMRPDHVHFRDPGGAILARALQDDLDRAGQEAR